MFLAEIDPTQLASLSVTSTSYSLVQLSAGGDAVLTAPSAPLLSGKILKLLVTGLVQISTGSSNAEISTYLGTSLASPVVFQTGGVPISGSPASTNFAVEYDLAWDSTAQQTIVPATSAYPSGSIVSPVASQSDIQFVIGAAKGSFGNSNFTLTITQFKLEAV